MATNSLSAFYRAVLQRASELDDATGAVLYDRCAANSDIDALVALCSAGAPASVRHRLAVEHRCERRVQVALLTAGELDPDDLEMLLDTNSDILSAAAKATRDPDVLAGCARHVTGRRGIRNKVVRAVLANPNTPVDDVVALLKLRADDDSTHRSDLAAFASSGPSDAHLAAVIATEADITMFARQEKLARRGVDATVWFGPRSCEAVVARLGANPTEIAATLTGSGGTIAASHMRRILGYANEGVDVADAFGPVRDALHSIEDKDVTLRLLGNELDEFISERVIAEDGIDSASLAARLSATDDENIIDEIIDIVCTRECDEELITAAAITNPNVTAAQLGRLIPWLDDPAAAFAASTVDTARVATLVSIGALDLASIAPGVALADVVDALAAIRPLGDDDHTALLYNDRLDAISLARVPVDVLTGAQNPPPQAVSALDELLGSDLGRWEMFERLAADSDDTVGAVAALTEMIAAQHA